MNPVDKKKATLQILGERRSEREKSKPQKLADEAEDKASKKLRQIREQRSKQMRKQLLWRKVFCTTIKQLWKLFSKSLTIVDWKLWKNINQII